MSQLVYDKVIIEQNDILGQMLGPIIQQSGYTLPLTVKSRLYYTKKDKDNPNKWFFPRTKIVDITNKRVDTAILNLSGLIEQALNMLHSNGLKIKQLDLSSCACDSGIAGTKEFLNLSDDELQSALEVKKIPE
jgi:hypothetical protein